MKTGASLKNRQGGAVAVLVGLSMIVLVGFLALVIDLAHLYVTKTELQNAADAAALGGARELNGTADGVTSAVNKATAIAAQNNYDFSKQVDIGSSSPAVISVGSSQYGPWVLASSVTTDEVAADKNFLKVDTGLRQLSTWVAPIFNLVTGGDYLTTSTFGMAVAGKYNIDVSPVGICQLPPDPTHPSYDAANPQSEYMSVGFERGVSYKVSDANPLGPGTMFWINPVEMSPTPCNPSNGSVAVTLPYICTGKMAFTPMAGQIVYTNTGVSNPQLDALDSRFDAYGPPSNCDPVTAPPDSNIKQYNYTDAAAGSPSRWMNPDPVRQNLRFDPVTGLPVPWAARTFADYGVLWSASRPANAVGDTTDAAVGARWESIYHAPPGAATNYPQYSPYAQGGGEFFQAPGHTGRPGRRFLNMVIVACSVAGGTCNPAPVVKIGRFFMQRKANVPTDKDIYVEFAGLLPTALPTSDIRLFR